MSDVCRDFGISRKTGYKIYNRYKECGLEAMTDRSRRPVRYANQLPMQIEKCILNLKKEKPHWSAPKLRERLIRNYPDIRPPAVSTIHAVLDRHSFWSKVVTHVFGMICYLCVRFGPIFVRPSCNTTRALVCSFCLVLGEIHKFKNWGNMVKGFYDTLKNTHSFLITGSARLDHFRKGGDSLLGRYHYYRLHPYSLPELKYKEGCSEHLLKYGGFPEPYTMADERSLRRWHTQRLNRLIRTDLRDWEDVKDLDKIYALAEELPNRVGSPLSINSLANDIEPNFKTIKRWYPLFCLKTLARIRLFMLLRPIQML